MNRRKQGNKKMERTAEKHNEKKRKNDGKHGERARGCVFGPECCQFLIGGAPLMESTLCESPKTMFFLQPSEKLIISGMMFFLSKKRSGKRGATNMNQQQTCEGLEEGVPASGSAPGSSSG